MEEYKPEERQQNQNQQKKDSREEAEARRHQIRSRRHNIETRSCHRPYLRAALAWNSEVLRMKKQKQGEKRERERGFLVGFLMEV